MLRDYAEIRASGHSRRPRALCGLIYVAFAALSLTIFARPASAAAEWMAAEGLTGESRYGKTRVTQLTAGTPTATQIAYDTGASGPPESFIVLQDHGVILVPVDASRNASMWGGASHFGSTNWGGFATAQATTTFYGDKEVNDLTGENAMRSGMAYGYVSYHVADSVGANASIGENQFWITSGPSYYLNGCPNYSPGHTSENMNYTCPRVPVAPGDFKFSILGLLSGTQINSAHDATFGNFAKSDSPHYRDLANYKSLVMTTTLDISRVGADASSRAAWVSFENGTRVNFTDITPDMDLAGCKMHIVSTNTASGEGEIIVSFSQTYSTGAFTRSRDDAVDVVGCFDCYDFDPVLVRKRAGPAGATMDLTGWGDMPESFPIGANDQVLKLGRGGLNATDPRLLGLSSARNETYQSYNSATQTPASTAAELQGLAGAPTLNVTEVRAVKITLRKHGGCAGRPDKPAAADDGTQGLSWPEAPADCPLWYLGSNDDEWNTVWGGEYAGIPAEKMSYCEPGEMNCFLIDIHLALELDDGTRTVLGSPANDPVRGAETGVFFMYDPEVSDDASKGYPPSYDDSLKPGTYVIV